MSRTTDRKVEIVGDSPQLVGAVWNGARLNQIIDIKLNENRHRVFYTRVHDCKEPIEYRSTDM